MNINELDSYNLADAVKFHRRLNPRIWGRDEHLLPAVRDKLLTIAADFQEFLGVDDLTVKDITISGSNAAYSYTKNSDIDLHLVVEMPDDPVYQELFTAKKYQYNDEHNIKIGGADVELYVQPADQAHHSLGIYSVKNGDWISIPQRKRAQIDDACVRDKVSDLDARIHAAIQSKDLGRISTLWDKIKAMRQTGLEQHGEFGCENIAFKMLRNKGCIAALKDAKTALQDLKLSLREAPAKPFRYGYGSTTVAEVSTPDGVSATTCMFLNEDDEENLVHEFIQHVAMELGIDPLPEIHLHTDPEWSTNNHSFGRYDPDSHTLNVSMPNRHILDVLRTTAHELVHCSQNQQHGGLPDDAGETGSRWENDANARAGIIMRDWANSHPEHFELPALEESASGYIPKNKREAAMPQYAMALSVDIKPGEVGRQANKLALKTGRNGKPGMLQPNAQNLLREFSEFVEEQKNLFEISMSPTSLRKLSAQTGALAGMEFEMCVPNTEGDDNNGDQEPDYEYDERCRSIEDAVQFFHDGDWNGRRDVERMRDRMQDDYQEWLSDKLYQDWERSGEEYLEEWVPNNVDESEWNPDGLEGEARQEALEEFIAAMHADPGSSDAFDEYREENQDSYDESDWLDAEDLDLMSYVENAYDVTWPHWSSVGSGETSIEDVADSFSNAVGRPVQASGSYHSGRVERPSTRNLQYIVEPDSSIDVDDNNDQGLEFVSPPLPIEELLSDLNKVKAWADKTGCYTNDSTGLHINVSVPGWTGGTDQLDYVKLALLLGDEFVLDSFGRSGNTYAKSAMGKIRDAVRKNPDRAQELMDKMKSGMDQLASKVVHSRSTEKYTSINVKDGYIEFRSPGGDWLNDNFAEIDNTLRRFTVALSAAVDPAAYRQEYLKKLYKLLNVSGEKDPLSYFAKYAAGELPKAALKSFVRQAQLERGIKRGKEPAAQPSQPQAGGQYYIVSYELDDGQTDRERVQAPNADAAMAQVRDEYENEGYEIVSIEANVAPNQAQSGVDTRVNYELYSRASGAVIDTFPARNDDEAQIRLNDYREHGAGQSNPDNFGVRRAGRGGTQSPTNQTAPHPEGRGRPHDPTGRYGIVARSDQVAYGRTGGPPPAYQFRFDMANLEQQGHGRYVLAAWAARNSVDPADYMVVDTTQYADAAQGGIIDVDIDLEPAPAPQPAGGEFTGNWLIRAEDGTVLHRFGGIGNSQADANRTAQTWAQRNPDVMRQHPGGVDVVPEMNESLTETNRLTLRDFNVKLSPHHRDQAHAKGVDLRRVDDVLFNLSKVKDKIMSLEPGRAFILHDGQGTGLGMRRHLGNRLTLATVYPVSPGFNKGLYPTFRVDTVMSEQGVAEADINPMANRESDRYGQQDTVGLNVGTKVGPGYTTFNPSAAATSGDPTVRTGVNANYSLPVGNGDISAGITKNVGSPNNQYNLQGRYKDFNAGVTSTPGQPNNVNLGWGTDLGPGKIRFDANKTLGPNSSTQGQIRYELPFNEEDVAENFADGSYHLQDGHHRTFLLNLLGDETVPAVVKEDVTEAKTVEFEGLTLKVIKQGHELMVDALDDWGNKVLGHVKFNIGDGRELDPQDLEVDERYQGQGIARVMYDYVKSLGYTIIRSHDQTDAGAGFWDKHRGEDVRVWENFADGRHPEDKGDSARHGIPKKASLAQLDKIGHGSGRKAQLARWQANMRRGRAK